MSSSDGETVDWDKFFFDITQFYDERQQDKAEGKNDFNILQSVLSVNDEVQLHTRFIYSLLNPNSKHYKGLVFLELFLKLINLEGFIDLENVSVIKERRLGDKGQADLVITDGNSIVLIENKLNASDQYKQAKRYIEGASYYGVVDPENIAFIYLTKRSSRPSDISLGYKNDEYGVEQGFSIKKDGAESWVVNVKNGERKARYANVHYSCKTSSISLMAWLDNCLATLGDEKSENIKWAIEQYKVVVKMASGENTSNVLSLKEFLASEDRIGLHKDAIEFRKQVDAAHRVWLHDFFETGIDEFFKTEIESGSLVRVLASDPKDKGKGDARSLLDDFVTGSFTDKNFYSAKSNYFRFKKGCFNQCVIYKPSARKDVMVVVLWGRVMLHAGLLFTQPSTIQAKEFIDLCDGIDGLRNKVEQRPVINMFRSAVTFHQRLDGQGILDIAHFEQEDNNLKKMLGAIKSFIAVEV